ncbi:uncharacterized protein LOC125676219 isoform X1 [Ostrea edulis]|uniref:uncharacterized protein LOC125676219 isoform X1 n=1 Tax=Ostrea edulis TaxID=37623 RepID=UPI0024AEEDC7|nr:uncharacterized protein LOC125676219 isoform X1 [Ostrea edulis]
MYFLDLMNLNRICICLDLMAYKAVGILPLLFACSSSITKSRTVCIRNRTDAGSSACCDNYEKDENGECNSCVPGYFGDFCKTPCPLGSFGKDCGGLCSLTCVPEDCDHVKGCLPTNTASVTASDASVFTTVPQHQILNISTSPPYLTHISSTTNITNHYTVLPSTKPPIAVSNPENGQFNSNYLIVGVGGFISVLLLVMIIQKCLKSKSAQRNISKRKVEDYNAPVDSIVKSRDTDKKKYGGLYHYGNKDHFYQQMESDYQEIDQCLEMANMTPGGRKPPGTEESSSSSEPNDSYLSPIAGSDTYVEPVTQEAYIEPQNLQPYLDSHKIPKGRENSSNERFHSYIEVVELGEMNPTETISHTNPDNVPRLSSSYDDVMWECPAVCHEMDDEKDNSYLDAVFS